jgi:hypothetical protein
MNPAVM